MRMLLLCETVLWTQCEDGAARDGAADAAV